MTQLINNEKQSEINYYISNDDNNFEIPEDKKITRLLNVLIENDYKDILTGNLQFKIQKTSNILTKDAETTIYDGIFTDTDNNINKNFKIIKNIFKDFENNDSANVKFENNDYEKIDFNNKFEIDSKRLYDLKNEYNEKKKFDNYRNEIKKWQNKIKNLDKKNRKLNKKKNFTKKYIDNENYQYARPISNDQVGSNYNSSRFINTERIQPTIKNQMKDHKVLKQNLKETPYKKNNQINKFKNDNNINYTYTCPISNKTVKVRGDPFN